MNFITLLDYVGTFAFAISGIRLASAKHFDWFGAYVVGFVTAVGGGTLRDLLLGLPPFWMQNVSYLVVSGFAFLFVVGLRKYVIRLNNTFFIFDAVGLGLFTVVGIQKSIAVGYPMWVGIIMGTLTGAAGGMLRDVLSLETLSPQQLATTVSFVTTERVRIPNLRCEDVVALGRAPYTNWIGRVQEQDKAIVERSLELVGMAAFAGKTMDRMSDGECQRVMIARALAQDTPIILLDEPTSFLDLPNRYELCTLLRRLAHDHRKCILFSTHELDIALSLCDSIALIDPPVLRYLPTPDMACSGYIERLFSNSFVTFDTESGTIKVRK